MKEVVLSFIVAVIVTGFGEVTSNTTAHSDSTSEAITSTKPSITTLTSHTSGVTASSTHGETTSSASPTTASPKPHDVYAVYEDGSYCIIMKANISITVNYVKANNKTESCTVYVPPPSDVTVTGSCSGANKQWITIHFNTDWNLTLSFEQVNGKYFLSNISLDWNLNTSCAGRLESGQINNNTHMFETSTGYLCMARKSLYSNASAVNDISGIYTEKLQLDAFKNNTKPTFADKPERCSEDSISNLVPIIVGACLGGLIIIVLIAYLIGRKRSRRGYESV